MGRDPRSGDEVDRLVGDADVVRAGFDELPVQVLLLDGPEHRLVGMNAAYRGFSGREDLIGLTVREAFPEIEGQEIFALIERVFDSGEPVHAREWRMEFEPGHGEPQTFFMDFDVLPRRDAAGSVHGILIQQTDVTDRVRRRQTAEAAADDAQQRYLAAREVVRTLQQALLPTRLPVLPAVDLAARYLVAGAEQHAGGDWFDVRVLPDGRIGLAVGDVVGHGVAAAAVMSQLRAVLADALETTADAEAALRQLERFAATVRGAHAATVVVAVLDPVAGVLDYVTRGHPAPVLVDAAGRGRSLLGSGGGPLGGELDGPAQRTELAEGDVVMFFSDGLVERRGRPYPEGIDRLTRISEGAVQGRIWPAGTASSVVERVCVDAVDILAREGHEDDATILAVSRRPAVAPLEIHAHATPSNVAEARARVRAWLADLRVDPTDQLALEMAVGEALDNAVEHGLAHDARGTIAVSLVLTADGRVHVSVGDDGTWREPGPAATGRGRGLVVLGSVGEGLDIAADPGGTTVRLHRRVGRPVRDPVREAPTPDPTEEPPFSAQPLPGAPDTIVVAGPVDSRSADEFRRALAHASRGSTTDSTVDLSAVTHLTSIGVAALVETREKAERAGRRCRFVAPTGTAAAFVLDLVGLSRGEPESDH